MEHVRACLIHTNLKHGERKSREWPHAKQMIEKHMKYVSFVVWFARIGI
jgi:hypothetical protein